MRLHSLPRFFSAGQQRDGDARQHTEAIENGNDGGVFLPVPVRAQQHEQADPGIGQQAREQAAKAEHAAQVGLRHDDGNGAVRDEAEQSEDELSKDGAVQHRAGQAFHADIMEQQIQREVHRDEHDGDLQRVAQGGEEHAALFFVAVAVLAFAEAVDALLRAEPTAEQQIGQISEHDADGGLGKNNECDGLPCNPGALRQGGEKDGQHLVRCGEEYSQHGTDGNGAGGKQCCCRARNTALRHNAEQAAQRGTGPARIAAQQAFVQAAAALEQLHEEIGEK